jgi:hypothetical protein
MQLNIFKKPVQKEFTEMTKSEKKDFLACDLIERMIRIEQKVRGSMGDGIVPYYKTEYFKELHASEKARFLEYLKNKEKNKKWRFLPGFLMIASGALIGSRITGNVVATEKNVPLVNWALLGVFLLVVIVYWIYVLTKKRRIKRLDKHFKVIENIIDKRKFKKK